MTSTDRTRRYVIIGGGAIGAHAAAQLTLVGIPAVLVARGAQLETLRRGPLEVQRRESVDTVPLTVAADAEEVGLTPDDVLVLAVKTQDSEAALADWAWQPVAGGSTPESLSVAAELPIVVLQNGVATEDLARRRFERVVSVGTIVPVTYLEPGRIVSLAAPTTGYLQLGALEGRQDADRALVESVASDFAEAGYLTRVREDITRRKHEKLLHNITNAVDVFDGGDDERAVLSERLIAETREVLAAAGWQIAEHPDSDVDLGAAFGFGRPAGGTSPPLRRSTWQSFARGSSSEVDFLNGEVVLLGRRHGIPTPVNDRVQQLLGLSHTLGEAPQTRTIAEVLAGVPHLQSITKEN